jgi:hypothetical protein
VPSRRPPEGLPYRVKGTYSSTLPILSPAPLTRRGRARPGRRDSTKAPLGEKDIIMITWILFGHLMTLGSTKRPQTSSVHDREKPRSSHQSATNRNGGPRISRFGVRAPSGAPSLISTNGWKKIKFRERAGWADASTQHCPSTPPEGQWEPIRFWVGICTAGL